MRLQLTEKLSIGDGTACSLGDDPDLAVVHACKDPCHRHAAGYSTRSLPSDHPHYLVLERGNHLFLNMIDPDTPMFMMPSFAAFMLFMAKHLPDRHVLIHCNQGESRSRSLAMLYMAKGLGLLPNESYEVAAAAFRQQFPFSPSRGITTWLTRNWASIN